MRACLALCAGALSSLAIAPAFADGSDAATAEALFEAGRQAMRRGDYDAACPKFADSERLDPAAGTLLNLADCEEHRGHLAAAWDAWHEAIRSLPAGDDRLGPARQRQQALDKRIPHLTVTLRAGAPAGTHVYRDDVELGSAALGVALPVDPGEHHLRVDAEGRSPSLVTVALGEGESKAIELSPGAPLEPAASAAPPAAPPAPVAGPTPGSTPVSTPAPPAPEQPGGHPALRTTGWILGGVGLAGLAAGATTGLLALSKKGAVQDHCPAPRGCDQTGYDAAQSGHAMAIASDISFAVGAGLLAAGVWLVLSNPPASSAATGLLVVPAPAGGGATVTLRRSF